MTLHARPDFRWKPPLERDVQKACTVLLRHAGFRVYSTSQYRASMVAVGMADLFAVHRVRPLALWWETKPPLARWRSEAGQMVYYHPHHPETWRPRPLEEAQQDFRDTLLRAGQRHSWGDLRCLEDALVELRLGSRLPSGVFQLEMRRAG